MPGEILVDGNNLLHAARDRGFFPLVGRETLVRIIAHWAKQSGTIVTIVFDGPAPASGLARQMAIAGVEVRYSAPRTADDDIVEAVARATRPRELGVVTADRAIRAEATRRKCQCLDITVFLEQLDEAWRQRPPSPRPAPPPPSKSPKFDPLSGSTSPPPPTEKPGRASPDDPMYELADEMDDPDDPFLGRLT